jgi:hypothetical protein
VDKEIKECRFIKSMGGNLRCTEVKSHIYCIQRPECYYKQLQAKTSECEGLKELGKCSYCENELIKKNDNLLSEKQILQGQLSEEREYTKELNKQMDNYVKNEQILREGLEEISNGCQYKEEDEEGCKECHLDKNTCLCMIAKQTLAKVERGEG